MLLNPTTSCTSGLASLKPITWFRFRLYQAGSRELQWQRCLGCTPFPKLLYSIPGPRTDCACLSWTCPMHLKSSQSWLGKQRGYSSSASSHISGYLCFAGWSQGGGWGGGGVALRLQEAFLILSFFIVFITKVENTSFLFL